MRFGGRWINGCLENEDNNIGAILIMNYLNSVEINQYNYWARDGEKTTTTIQASK